MNPLVHRGWRQILPEVIVGILAFFTVIGAAVFVVYQLTQMKVLAVENDIYALDPEAPQGFAGVSEDSYIYLETKR